MKLLNIEYLNLILDLKKTNVTWDYIVRFHMVPATNKISSCAVQCLGWCFTSCAVQCLGWWFTCINYQYRAGSSIKFKTFWGQTDSKRYTENDLLTITARNEDNLIKRGAVLKKRLVFFQPLSARGCDHLPICHQ